jgi:hypothetical protein
MMFLILALASYILFALLEAFIGHWAYIIWLVILAIVGVLNIKKIAIINPLLLIGFPLMLTSYWLNQHFYAGVISRWPTVIVTLTWTLAACVAAKVKKKHLRLAICALALSIIAFTTFTSLPKYTYAEAKEIIAQEINITAADLGPGLGRMPILRHLDSRPSFFVDSSYFFDDLSAEKSTSYIFDPVSGRWGKATSTTEPFLP